MTVVVALVLALGVFLVYDALTTRVAKRAWLSELHGRVAGWLAECGLGNVTPLQFVALCGGLGLALAILALVVIGALAVAVVALIAGTVAPVAYFLARRRTLRGARRGAWPEAVELLAGAVRAGDTLPAACAVVAERGPDALRSAFLAVSNDHRLSGDLVGALERVGRALADPVADRVVATLVIAHRVGGRELGRVLRTLSAFLREELAVRKEIEARQSWTLVAARVAAAAPWVVLVLVASRPQGAAAYSTFTGMIVVLAGAAATVVGYRAMLHLAKLPEEPRVLARSDAHSGALA
ncbi:MAG TPA: type II secretion system F family protein [Acidimicrobiia bacterium]